MAAFHTRRGIEKFLYYATIVIGILFVLVALVSAYLLAHEL
jgi:preprotein translocase subunit SecG